jgi:hypothetical protein
VSQTFSSNAPSDSYALTFYGKRGTGTRYASVVAYTATNNYEIATFDLAGGAVTYYSGSSSTYTGVSATQTASGNGYYKCVFKFTGQVSGPAVYMSDVASPTSWGNYAVYQYAGDSSSSIVLSKFSLASTGAADYQPTTTQIHREYAPTLQTAAINAPRFEYSPTDSASMGLLIEGSSTNLITRSHELDNAGGWNAYSTSTIDANVAVGPDGTLTADLIRPTTAAAGHYVQTASPITTVDSTTYTVSAYVKAAGLTKTRLFFIRGTSPYTTAAFGLFTLTGDGSVEDVTGSATISPVGNGWYRISVTGPAVTTLTTVVIQPTNDSGTAVFAGDGYSGILCTGVQFELGSHCSSLISTSGSAVTRASDSAAMVNSSLFDNGGGTLYAEASRQAQNTYNGIFSVDDGSGSNIVQMFGNTTNFRAEIASGGTTVANMNAAGNTVNTFHKHCLSFSPSEAKYFVNGSQIGSTDTDLNIPTMSQIHLGELNTSGNHLNGHIRKVAVYSEPVSATNAAALTK